MTGQRRRTPRRRGAVPARRRGSRRALWIGAATAVVVAATIVAVVAGGGGDRPDNAAFRDAFDAGRAQEVTVQGTVQQLLPDSSGSDGAHQRFTVDVSGVGVEIDHNISLAPRVPVHPGDTVVVHGQFEPDPGHPVIHYTHHSTSSHHEGGWIELGGQTYS